MDVGCGREDAAVAGAADGQVEDVGAEPVGGEVAERGVAGQLVEPEEGGGLHARRAADELVDEVVEGRAGRPLGQEGEEHEPAVAVREVGAGLELRGVAVEHGEEVLGGGQLVHGDGQHVVGDVALLVLVEVVADAGPVAEELLDGHAVVHQREVVAEEGPRGGVAAERAPLDQRHHGRAR